VLTIHLKRFSPMGRKVGHPVKYDDKLSLEPYMSQGTFGPAYSLYGIISHAGGGPNSGHYYAHIKDSTGQWHEMNDESVSRHSGAPLSMKNAYVLFYVREKGQALESAITQLQQRPNFKNGLAAGMKKRKVTENEDEGEDTGVAASPSKARFIGPIMPSPSSLKSPASDSNKKQKLDPQAKALKEKIQAVKAGPSALQSLSQYDETDEEEDQVSSKESTEKAKEKLPIPIPTPTAVPPVNFYGGPSETRQRSNAEGNRIPFSPSTNRSPTNGGFKKRRGGANPYSRLKGSNNLQTYAKKKRFII
jgi:ubiquitin carboxyl-terminal hydrolase 36/42